MKKALPLILLTMSLTSAAQNVMTPETLWKLGRLTPMGLSTDKKLVVFKVSTPSMADNKSNSKFYTVPVNGGADLLLLLPLLGEAFLAGGLRVAIGLFLLNYRRPGQASRSCMAASTRPH